MGWLKQHYKTLILVLGEIISSVWTAATLVLDLMGVIPGMLDWRSSSLIGFIIFAALSFVHICSLQRRLAPQLDLVLGNFPACIHRFRDNDHVLTLLRVGLINRGGRTIENVRVSLEDMEPQGITFGPIRLLFMHQRQADEEYPLHPSDRPSLYVDVIQDVYMSDPPQRKFTLRYAVSGVANVLEPGNYGLTLLAEGEDVQPCRKKYLVTQDGENISLIEG